MLVLRNALPIAVGAVLTLFAAPSFADQIIGLPTTSSTGNCFPWGCSYSGEYQQVYTAGAFSGPITITGLEFYNTQFNSGATAMNAGNWNISLSTTSADWNTLSSNFASNIGGDNTSVFSGNLFQPWAFGDTLQIVLTTPFAYNPANGNLLLDVVVSSASAPGGSIYFDVNNSSSQMGRVTYNGSVENRALITGFNTTSAVPIPAALPLFAGGLGLLAWMSRRKRQHAA